MVAAVIKKNEKMVLLLLDQGADINARGGEYGTALVAAVYNNNEKMVLLLLDQGADINVVSGDKGTALVAAVYNKNEDMVLLLLIHGADINVGGGRYGTALGAAIYSGKEDIVSLLLARGADIQTSLVEAASLSLRDMIPLLLGRGADINAACNNKYGTALAIAAFQGNQDIVSLLLGLGANIDIVGGEYGTALGAAAFGGQTDIVSLLLEHGADVLHAGGSYSTTLGMYPSVLDAALSEGSVAGESLLALLKTAMKKIDGPRNQLNADPVDNALCRPPFPLPYMAPSGPSLSFPPLPMPNIPPNINPPDISSTSFPAGGNIAPEQADIPCREINEEVLRQVLTALVGLHDHTTQAKRHWIRSDVCYFRTCNFDFGLAYAAARIAWKDFNSIDSSVICRQRGQWHRHSQRLDEAQAEAIKIDSSASEQELITDPYSVMPRRIWDLKSNRTINFQMLHSALPDIGTPPTFWTVSHSWTNDMSPTWTAVNQHQWPIPLPKDITLDKLRSELLTLGAEYIWIDVVCLRQQGSDPNSEQLRKEEWRLDVPTIGNVYRAAARIVCYFNGLGIRFSNEGWDDPRHWLQRAWTLQEITAEISTINGGTKRGRGQIFLNSKARYLERLLT